MSQSGTLRDALDAANDNPFGSVSEYVERERRVVKRRVRKNNAWATAFMIFAALMFIGSLVLALEYWLINDWTFSGSSNDLNQVALKAYSYVEATSSVTANEMAKYSGTQYALMASAFFACLAFRRGATDRVKGGWLLLYIFSTLGILALYFFWCVKNVCGGDMGLWLENITTSYSGTCFITTAVYAVIYFISFLVVRGAGLCEGKVDRIRRRENGKIHGGVCFMYLLASALSWIGLIIMIVVIIAVKINVNKKRDDDDFDLAPFDEWEETAASYGY